MENQQKQEKGEDESEGSESPKIPEDQAIIDALKSISKKRGKKKPRGVGNRLDNFEKNYKCQLKNFE